MISEDDFLSNFYRSVFDRMTLGAVALNSHLVIAGLNPAMQSLWGVSNGDFLGAPVIEPLSRWWGEDAALEFTGRLGDLLHTGESLALEKEVCRGADIRQYFQFKVSPLLNPSGEITGLLLLCEDITPPKQVEQALQESEARFRQAFDHANVGITLVGLDGRYLRVNPALSHMLGYTQQELGAMSVQDTIHPDDLDAGRDFIQRALAGEISSAAFEKRHLHKSGRVVWTLISSVLVRDALGSPACFISMVQDVSDRKQAEAALKESEEKLLSIFRVAPVGIGLVDNRIIREANDTFCRMTGYTREELVGQSARFLYSTEEEYEHVGLEKYRQIAAMGTGTVETRWKHKDGNILNVLLSSTPLDVTDFSKGVTFTALDITARHQAEAALAEEAIWRRILMEQSRDGIVVLDQTGKVFEANQRYADMLGYSAEEVRELYVWDWDTQFTREQLEEMIRLIDAAGDNFQTRHRRKDGSCLDVEISTNGAVVGGRKLVFCVCRDISHRKAAEEALRESEAKYRLVFENAPVGIMHFDQKGIVTDCNNKFADIIGAPKGEFLGFNMPRQLRDEKMRDAVMASLNGKVGYYEGDYLSVTANKLTTVRAIFQPIRSPDRELLGGVTIFEDITERKQAEEAFEVLVNHAPMGIYIVQDGKFQMINTGFEKATGYLAQELFGRDCLLPVHPDYREGVRQNAIRMLKGESDLAYEFPLNTANGGTIWVMEKVTSTVYQGKRATLGYFLDVSERKNLESQFLQAQKMEAVGRLAGGVAHDFNNLLNVIIGYSEIMKLDLKKADPLCQYVDEIAKAANRAASLTQQLLAFSRKQLLQPQVLNLNDKVTGMQSMVERLIGEDIEMLAVVDPFLGLVKADPGQIEQIIMNLAVNARDAMPQGGKLTLETANVYLDEAYAQKHFYVNPGPYVMLAVSDNGEGIDAATQERLFEPFFTTKEDGKGTGLGLCTVYGIVKQSGGHIQVYSEIGLGTTFKVYLPQVQEAVSAIPKTKPLGRELHGSETILVVEDEDMVRELIFRNLKMFGYKVLEARHGGEALLVCERHPGPIHLMLTDVVMPQMSGRELADRLAPLRPEMQVLFMSGYTENAVVHHGILDSSVSFICKPFSPMVLVERVREILDEVKG